MASLQLLLLLLLLLSLSPASSSTSSNPFSPKSSFLRYYHRKVPNHRPLPSFLLSKLSPLSAPAAASFPFLLSSSSSASLSSLCSSANLLCPPYSSLSLPPSPNSDFSSYTNTNFTNYGTSHTGGKDSFKRYSPDENIPVDSFRRYSRSSSSRDDSFSSYSSDGNVVTTDFTSYATSSTSGSGSFSSYAHTANVPDLKFTNYDADAVGRHRSFNSYSDDTNSGGQNFAGYGKRSNGVPTNFNSYAASSNTIGSGFSGYGENGNSANDNFTSYGGGGDGNGPTNTFRAYGENGNGGTDTFAAYRDKANVGDDSFQSYAKHGNAAKAQFENYGNSFNPGTDSFSGYGEGSTTHDIGFKTYAGENTTFKAYVKSGVTFTTNRNASSVPTSKGKSVNKWVEPGKFFRESSLKNGTSMPMPDIRDKTPKRSFLPRSIAEKLPFSATEVSHIFQLPADSALGKSVADTVAECERAPSRGETKRCATSAEDLIDFAVSVLGNDVVVRSTDNVRGSRGNVLIGNVRGINGGKVTLSVSCHQSLFPYLVYYCHSVPKVRVYVADILDDNSREKINQGVAICHLDTSDWSPMHWAFLALGSKPGEIEVCHWIFEGDMTWTVAD